MDGIDVLFKEYDTLRAESISRANNGFQVIGVGVALGATLLTWIGSHGLDRTFWLSFGVFIFFVCGSLFVITRDTAWVAFRLRQLESEINNIAGGELLKWETHYGGSLHGWIFRKGPPKSI
jgi:hypothetical protein